MAITKSLQMVFRNAGEGKVTLSVADPLDSLDSTVVTTAMNAIIEQDIFLSEGGGLVAPVGARIVSREVSDLFEETV